MGDRDARKRLARKVAVLETIAAEQKDYPGYCAEFATALIESELCLLVTESRRYWCMHIEDVTSRASKRSRR